VPSRLALPRVPRERKVSLTSVWHILGGELIRVQASDVDRTGVLIVSKTKSRELRRIPPPPATLAEVRQRIGRLVAFSEPGSFARMARKLSGVERFHVHMLRHTFACSWVDRGGSLAALQHLLGHSSITM